MFALVIGTLNNKCYTNCKYKCRNIKLLNIILLL